MAESSKINIGLIGLGGIAQKAYLPILANHAKVNPILCTRNSQLLNQLSNQYRIKEIYTNVDELLKTKIDAAMVHSSTESHFEIVSKLLNAGIPVFVDKPLTYSINESEELLNLASQKRILLYLGFNRRFAPLIQSLADQLNPIQILWQKNRVNLPGDSRAFIFDDFIHVIDSLRFLGQGEIKNLHVFSRFQNNALESIQVQWQQNETLLSGIMNRISGITEERVEYYTPGNKWLIEDLTSGWHYEKENKNTIGFGNWKNTLYKRGFVNMIEDWLNVLQNGNFDSNRIQDIWETHHLCESILGKISIAESNL
ncbi:MAG: virulence factor [Saprospiraceae bacterium]|jgi:virulence factor